MSGILSRTPESPIMFLVLLALVTSFPFFFLYGEGIYIITITVNELKLQQSAQEDRDLPRKKKSTFVNFLFVL